MEGGENETQEEKEDENCSDSHHVLCSYPILVTLL